MLNQEMWYTVYRSLWNRWLLAVPLFFLLRFDKVKEKFQKKNNYDSHDTSFRDITAHM
jgi:hypothetical protein